MEKKEIGTVIMRAIQTKTIIFKIFVCLCLTIPIYQKISYGFFICISGVT